MSFFKKKPIIVLAAVLGVAVIFAAVSHLTNGALSRTASVIITPAEGVVSRLVSPISRIRDNLADADELRKENEQLKLRVDELTLQNRSAQDYIKENERLNELLHLRDGMIDKEVLAAKVISADSDNFSYTITINRGSADGIGIDNAVISTLGAVGRVSELGEHWARITTILSPEHAMGVKVSRTGDNAVLDGDGTLFRKNQCRLDYITGAGDLIAGDILVSSGMGGIYPPDITVGRIVEIRSDNSGTVDYATVEPTVDFSRLYEVLVITSWDTESTAPQYVEQNTITSEQTDVDIVPEDIENAQG